MSLIIPKHGRTALRQLQNDYLITGTIAQFYAINDSATYAYAFDVDAIDIVTGGSSLTFVLSSALVNFHFSYCTCPSSSLPLNIDGFNIAKGAPNKAQLSWFW